MDKTQISYSEGLLLWLKNLYINNRRPFLAAMVTGFAAHMYMFANKLVNHDDIEALFYKGATVTSGRWGLELSRLIFPDWSMPWIYGLLTLLFIAVSVCIILRVLNISSPVLQIILAAAVVSFPSLTGTFCFMFTSAAYGLAFFLSVLCVWFYRKGGLLNAFAAALTLVLCLGIYQAYVSISASLLVILMIQDCLEGEKSPWQILVWGFKALAMMAAALIIYFIVTLLVFKFTGTEFNDYVLENVNSGASIPGKIRMAYQNFWDIFTFRNYYVISTEASRIVHLGLILLVLFGAVLAAKRKTAPLNWALLALLILLLPLSINCMYLMMSAQSIHTLVLYSFVCVYFLAAVIIEKNKAISRKVLKDLTALMMCLVVASNIYFANMCYLKMHLQYEAADSFYVSMIAQIKDTEGFDANSRLAIIGQQDNLLYYAPELDTSLLLGPSNDLINIYSRENFFRQYLGFDIAFADEKEIEEISAMPEFEQMAEYPYYGSIEKIGDYIVVKLG